MSKAERIAYSVDASQLIRIRSPEDGIVELEAVNRGHRTEVWLDDEGITQLISALLEIRPDCG